MILRSFLHFSIVIGPAYWQRILSKATYARWRNFIVAAALLSYTFHPGGGLYRDAVMINAAEHTGLSAAHLFVRLLVGSRTLFWLILVFGYELPPLLGIPLNALCLTIMAYTKGSAPFCSTMQTASTQPLFHYIAASIPLVSIIPMAHPELAEGADICNPLVRWLVIVLAFLLPTAVQLATDYSARKTFARQNPWLLSPADRTVWLDPAKGEGSAASVALVTYVHLSTALWYVLMWGQLMPAATALAGFRAVQMS